MNTVQTLGVVDYIICGGVLVISLAIGIYYGCTGGKQRTTEEFLLADRKMPILPVAMSLVATALSTVTVLGTPAEVYRFGTMYLMAIFGYMIAVPIIVHVYHPVFFNLRLTSVFEYLEMRFSKGVRILAAILYIIQMLFYIALVMYGPALALSAVTGLNVWVSVLSAGIVCTIYTTMGGMKAVIWTDTFQAMILLAGILAVTIRGTLDSGGLSNLWQIASQGDRLKFFDWAVNPLVRHTNWNLCIGTTVIWLSILGTSQTGVQRILSCPTAKHAKLSTWLSFPVLGVAILLSGFCGVVLYAHYRFCDPVSSKRIQAVDQMLPLYVLERFSDIPGFVGLIIACILSAALSTFSSGLNSIAAVCFQDIFMNMKYFKGMSSERSAILTKVLASGAGVVTMLLCYVVSLWGAILTVAISLFGMIGSPLVGVFTLGIIYPWTNTKGAYCGLLCGLVITVWLGIGARLHPQPLIPPPLPVSTANCTFLDDIVFNATTQLVSIPRVTEEFYASVTTATSTISPSQGPGFVSIYGISYMWYGPIALIIVTVVGLLVSFITGAKDPKELNRQLLSPLVLMICGCFIDKEPPTSIDDKMQDATYKNRAFDNTEKQP